MWHASVAIVDSKLGALPLTLQLRLRQTAAGLVRGVGVATILREERGQQAAHARRPLTDREINGLPADWLALPAMDMAGDMEAWKD